MRRVQSNTLDVGIDVHLKNWSTAILSKHSVLRRFLQVDCEGPTLISYIVEITLDTPLSEEPRPQ